MNPVAERLGELGLPEPTASLAARPWDAVLVGGGHNGLACAAYLAQAGQSVLVLERRERVGGACTLERPFGDERYVCSPCAYVIGLLDPLVISELELRRRGFEVYVADPQLWVPFEDGTAFAEWLDPARTRASLEAFGVSARDIAGYERWSELFDATRRRLRYGDRDTWVGDAPRRAEIEELLGGEQAMIDLVFEASIAETLEDHVSDQRLHDALYGGGIIGTFAGPRDPGTAMVKLMHHTGDLEGQGSVWGYVKGGMGMASFAIADAAREAGAVIACGVPVGEIVPGEGVALEDGTFIPARSVICNADPKRALAMLGGQALPAGFRARLEAWDVRSPVVKFNAALRRLPSFTAAPGEDFWTRAMVELTTGLDDAQAGSVAAAAGELAVAFAEVYVQTGHDPTPAPEGRHLMSVFSQYGPYDADAEAAGRAVIELISRFAPDFEDCLEYHETLVGRDIEARVGLTGGHIFQGQVLPGQMWEHRLAARTELEGLYFCGAATHPGGSVIGLNGRNAAMAVLADAGIAAPQAASL